MSLDKQSFLERIEDTLFNIAYAKLGLKPIGKCSVEELQKELNKRLNNYEKINIAEILKDCPKGMELDCTVLDNIVFDSISNGVYPIKVITKDGSKSLNLTKYGCTSENKNAKCVIFPKGKTTWEGFQRPFKDGDILAYTSSYTNVFIYRNKDNEPKYTTSFYVGYTIGVENHNFHVYNKSILIALNENCEVRLATEEEKTETLRCNQG